MEKGNDMLKKEGKGGRMSVKKLERLLTHDAKP
jgi:hypothetical protein